MMNTNTEMMTGTPSPPLRMMAPKGAPMKKKIRQESDSVTFQCAQLSTYYSAREIKTADTLSGDYKSLTISTPSPIYVCNSSSVTIRSNEGE